MRKLFGGRLATGFVAAVVEAWQELRIHKLRVMLSLFGVFVAVASLTGAVALASIAKQALVEQNERQGRPAMIGIYAYSETGTPISPARIRPAVFEVADKFDIEYVTMVGNQWETLKARSASATKGLETRIVDPDYAPMHRLLVSQGRWLEAGDADNLSPSIVVDQRFLKKLGMVGVPVPFTVDLIGPTTVTATVVGVAAGPQMSDMPLVYMLGDTYDHWFGADLPLQDASFEMWVPIPGSEDLAQAVSQALRAELPGLHADAQRQDYLAWSDGDEYKEVALVVSAIAGVILLLGALSLLNVALVTIQQRVREVGIRRSFGATTGRVFFSVMMESVVATFVAGAAGVIAAIAVINSSWVQKHVLDGVDDVPGFPVEVALLGLGVAVGVGALAGVLPALVAARVKIVDAIRF